MTYPEDGRSLAHLEQLLEEQPHPPAGIKGLAERAEDCRQEVLTAWERRRRGRGSS